MRKKPIIAMDIPSGGFGRGGGPYTSATRTMDSGLKSKYDFRKIIYKKELGKGISVKRIRDLVSQIKDLKPDIVHFTGLQLSGFHMAIACKFAGVKNTVVTVRGFSGDVIFFNNAKKIILTYLLEPITLIFSKRVIGVSNYVVKRKMIQFLAKRKSQFIYNFPPSNKNFKKSDGLRNELGISPEDIVVTSIARITKDKGYHVLEKAIKNLPEASNIKFIIVGDGDYLEVMKKNLKDKALAKSIFFLGFRSDINFILNSSDIFVLPTLHETLSVALLEASQAGLALIASDTGGVPEIVINDYNGKLVEPGNVKKLSKSIFDLAQNKDLINLYGKNAKLNIKVKFSSEEIINKLDKIYKSLLYND